MTDFLDEKRDEIDGRLAELRPLVEEYNRLLAASAALRGVDGTGGMSTSVGVAASGVIASAPSPGPVDVSIAMSDGATVTEAESEAPSPSVPADPGSGPGSGSGSGPGSDPGLGQGPGSGLDPAPVRRGPGRPRGSGGSKSSEGREGVSSNGGDDAGASLAAPLPSSGPRRAGRPKGSGTRAAEALRIVREHPGVTIPELADRMGIKQNYLYRVLPELVQEGKVAKQGRGWHPRAA